MEPLTVSFVGEPVAKGRARMMVAKGRPIAYTPAKTRKYEAALQYAVREAMGDRLRFIGAVVVNITANLPVPASWPKWKREAALLGNVMPASRPDADNYAKSALDALNAVAINDDAQVTTLTVKKRYSERPSLQIEVHDEGAIQ